MNGNAVARPATALGYVLVGLGAAALIETVFVWRSYADLPASMQPYLVSGPNAAGVQYVWLVAVCAAVVAVATGRGIRLRLLVPLAILLAVNPITEFAVLSPFTGTHDEPIGYGLLQSVAMVLAGAAMVLIARHAGGRTAVAERAEADRASAGID